METMYEISQFLRKKGTPYFDESDLEMYIKEIENKIGAKINSILSNYKTLIQEGETVQLECSFLTNKSIYDFTLKNKTIESYCFFLKDIITVSEEVSASNRTLRVANGDAIALFYKSFSENDRKSLSAYCESIINEINKI